MESLILKIVALVCVTIVNVVMMITNQNNEDTAGTAIVVETMALAIIFIPWDKVIAFLRQ